MCSIYSEPEKEYYLKCKKCGEVSDLTELIEATAKTDAKTQCMDDPAETNVARLFRKDFEDMQHGVTGVSTGWQLECPHCNMYQFVSNGYTVVGSAKYPVAAAVKGKVRPLQKKRSYIKERVNESKHNK